MTIPGQNVSYDINASNNTLDRYYTNAAGEQVTIDTWLAVGGEYHNIGASGTWIFEAEAAGTCTVFPEGEEKTMYDWTLCVDIPDDIPGCVEVGSGTLMPVECCPE